MKRKRFLGILGLLTIVALTVVIALPGISLAAKKSGDGTIKMKVGTGVPGSSMSAHQIEKFCKLVTDRTDGKVKFDFFHDSMLGQEGPLVEAAGLGTVDVVMSDAAYIANINPAFGVLDFMYVYRDLKGYKKVLDSNIFDELSTDVAKVSGIIPLAPFILGPRHLMTVNKIVKNPEDAKGLLFRSQPSELSQYFTKTLGGTPTPIPWPETYVALKQGMAVGAECSIECIWYGNWHEVCNYLILTGHVYTNEIVSMSKLAWKLLTPDQQKIVKAAAMEVAVWKIDQVEPSTKSFFKKMMAANPKLEVIELTDKEKNVFKERAAKFAKDFKAKNAKYNWGTYYDRVVKLGWE